MPGSPAAVCCEELSKVYRTATSAVHALDGVSTEIPSGVLAAIAGRSGSGKSTLLRLIAGLDRVTSGRLIVDDLPLQGGSSRRLRQVRRDSVGYLFQRASDNFFPHLTVGEHMRVATARSQRPSIDTDRILEILGIAERADHLPAELSGGEQARAALAQVLARGVGIVVADEPTAELDTASADRVLRAIQDLVEIGVTFVLATHDATVMRRANVVIELDRGRIRSKTRDRGEVPLPRVSDRLREWEEDDRDRRSSEPVMDVSGITKTFRRGEETVHAVEDARFAIRGGEFVALVGRSGSGKTTLMNIAAGWENPDSGAITVLGRDPGGSMPVWAELAVLPQKLGLLDELTVRENVEYPARLAKRLEEAQPVVDRLLEALGIDHLAARYPKETSVGEQQRTALARALVLSPRLILVDEPTGHQDREFGDTIYEALREAVARGGACLAATHDESILRHADRVLSMSDGRLSEQER